MNTSRLIEQFAAWSAEGEALVLASVYATEGSTYSKAGARMLITGDGRFHGMLSGGCLEGDLAERARQVLDSGSPLAVTYDLGKNDEELWGLGVGCDGLMRIFLQPLREDTGYEPFATMAKALQGDTHQVAVTVIESSADGLSPGDTLVTVDSELAYNDAPESFLAELSAAVGETLLDNQSTLKSITVPGGEVTVLAAVLTPPPRVLILGAGLDATPVVRFAVELGWRVTIQDHRPAYVETGDFSAAEHVHCVPVAELGQAVDLDRYAGVIVMSHHLASDRSYLEQLARTHIGYIGLLGPADRRQRLLDELGETGERLAERVHGPAGLDIGGRGPASIALSIIAEMHQHLVRGNEG